MLQPSPYMFGMGAASTSLLNPAGKVVFRSHGDLVSNEVRSALVSAVSCIEPWYFTHAYGIRLNILASFYGAHQGPLLRSRVVSLDLHILVLNILRSDVRPVA